MLTRKLLRETRDRDGRAGRLKDYVVEYEKLQELAKQYIRQEFGVFSLSTAEIEALTSIFIRTGKIPHGFRAVRLESKGDEDANSGKTTATAG
jgi:hypothetical protein